MDKCWISLMVLASMFLTFPTAHAAGSNDRDLSELKYSIYYLTNSKIYRVVLPDHSKAEPVFSPPKDSPDEQVQFSTLTCGPDGKLLLGKIHMGLSPGSETGRLAKNKMTIVTYDTKTRKLSTLVDLGDMPVRFPVLSPDGLQLAMTGHSAFLIKDLQKGTVKYYDQFADPPSLMIPWSWSPDGNLLALTSGGPGTKAQIHLFDRTKKTLSPWKEGSQPCFSPNGKRIAYLLAGKNRELMISDREGNAIQSFNRYFFKNIDGWISEDKVIFTIGVFAYVNHIGIANLTTGKMYDIDVPSEGEIHGICAVKEY